MVGRRCYDIPNDPGGGLTQECQGGCPSIRYLRAGLVPAQCQMRMSSLSGDRKWISVAPIVVMGFCSYNLLIYLLDEAPEGRSGTLEDSLEMPIKQGGQRAALDASASANSSRVARVQTQRELEILELVAQGWETPRIAPNWPSASTPSATIFATGDTN